MGFGVLLEIATLSDWHTMGWHLASERQRRITTYLTPLLSPILNHQEYMSTYVFFGGAVVAVTEAWSSRSDVVSVL